SQRQVHHSQLWRTARSGFTCWREKTGLSFLRPAAVYEFFSCFFSRTLPLAATAPFSKVRDKKGRAAKKTAWVAPSRLVLSQFWFWFLFRLQNQQRRRHSCTKRGV